MAKAVVQSELGLIEPWAVMLVGATGTGKTWFLTQYLLNRSGRDGATERPVARLNTIDSVIWVAPKASLVQPGLSKLSKYFAEHIHFVPYEEATQVKLDEIIDKNHASGYHTALVADDCMFGSNRGLTAYFNEVAVHGRHRQIQLFTLQQRVFAGDRTKRLNAKFICLWHFAGKSEARALFTQLAADKADSAKLMHAYKQIVARPHGMMCLDLTGRSTKEFPCAVRDTKLDRFVPSLWDAT